MHLCRCSPTLMLLLAVALFAGAGQTLAGGSGVVVPSPSTLGAAGLACVARAGTTKLFTCCLTPICAANATGGRRGLLGVCDHCNVPLCQGGCKCDNQCNCLTTTNSGG